ncbi:MAG: hypothetical protein ABFS86_05030 [Planctomycetota bacterium]
MRTALLLLFLAVPASAAGVRLSADVAEVEFGVGFGVSVTRSADADWDDTRLFPLVVERIDARPSGDDEVIRYRAWAFTPGEIAVDPGAGAEPLLLRVLTTVDPAEPGPVELPGDLLAPEAGLPWPWFVAILAAVAGAAVLLLRREERPAPPPETPPEPPSHETALARLAALRDVEPATHDETQRWFLEAYGVVREYVGARHDVRTDVMTTVECLRLEGVADASRGFLGAYLGRCDEVKFGRRRPDGAERSDLLDKAEAFVRGEAAP